MLLYPPPPPVSSRGAPRRTAGFALLAILLLIAALTMMIGMSLQSAQDSRRVAAQAHHEQRAAAIAEAGMERTRAYIHSVLESNIDLDRVLDPELDTDCANSFTDPPASAMDDHVPLFTDTSQVFEYPASSRMYYKFARHGGGGYLVRIDDNEDDGLDNTSLNILAATTNNNLRSPNNCQEGINAGTVNHNPVRDRDRSVIVTAIGFYPLALDPAPAPLPNNAQLLALLERAQARRVLRARVGPALNAGLIIGGDVDFRGNSAVCGAFGNVLATRSLSSSGGGNPELCGTNCDTGASACTAMAAGSCNLSFSNSSSSCQGGASVPSPPPVHVWSSINAPPPCPTPTTCTPFYYLRPNANGAVNLLMWNYRQCSNPQEELLIPTPQSRPQCWSEVYDGTRANAACATFAPDPTLLAFADGVHLQREDPSELTRQAVMGAALPFPQHSNDPLVPTICPTIPAPQALFELNDEPFYTGATDCESPNTPYPTNPAHLQARNVQKANFRYRFNNALLPRGVWLVEGSVHFEGNTPDCAGLTASMINGWRASLMTTGNLKITGVVFLRPMHPRGYALLSGRDLSVETGNTRFGACTLDAANQGVTGPGAIMVHEQIQLKSDSTITAQVVVQGAGTCSTAETSSEFRGNSEIQVTHLPPISAGNAANLMSWSDSAL